jgi:hypothetical protein
MELSGTSPADIASTGYRATSKPSRSKPRFFVAIAIFMTVIVAVGFWPSYYGPLLRGVAARPLVIHLHGIVFIGWMALLLAQVALVATGRTAAHRKVGTAGIVYGFLVIAMGLVVGFAAPILHVAAGEWDMDRAAGFLLVILGDMALFGGFFVAAMIYRRKPETHKRLILLATVALLFAAVGRMTFIPSPLISAVVWLSPVLIGIAYDAFTRRRVHTVYIVGTIILFIGACRLFLAGSEAWLKIGRSLLAIFIG